MAPSLRTYAFVELPHFASSRAELLDDDSYAALQGFLVRHPRAGDVVPESGGCRKLRWSRAGSGKRGGVRVLYFVQDRHGRIWLLTMYAKTARENISAAELRRYLEVIDHAEIE